MENELIKKINLRGIKIELQQLTYSEDEEFQFATKAYRILKEFSNFLPKSHKKLGITEFFVKNTDRLFKSTKTSPLEAEISRFISVMALYKSSGEIEMYREFFLGNIGIKAAKLFVKFFIEMSNINPSLYENRLKLLRHLRFDIKKALSLSAMILKEDLAIANFANAIAGVFEKSKSLTHSLTGELFGKHIISAYIISHNVSDKEAKSGPEGVWLNWNSGDPQAFEIQIPKPQEEQTLLGGQEPSATNGVNRQENPLTIEKVNAGYKKAMKAKNRQQGDEKSGKAAPQDQAPNEFMEENLVRICHKYVFDEPIVPAKPMAKGQEPVDLSNNEDIDKQLIYLRTKLEKQRLELEMQKSIWKLVLSNSRQAIKNYRELKNEIGSTEALANAFLNVIDKNTDEWRRLFIIKNNDVEDLYRYKFLIAAVLESCAQDLGRDLREFRFAHEEDDRQMDLLLGKKRGFDLHEYLTAVYKSQKLKFDADIGDEEAEHHGGKEVDFETEEIIEGDNKGQIHQRIEEFAFPNQASVGEKGKPSLASGPSDKRVGKGLKPQGSKSIKRNSSEEKEDFPVETEEEREKRLENMKANLSKLKSDLVYGRNKKKSVKKKTVGGLKR